MSLSTYKYCPLTDDELIQEIRDRGLLKNMSQTFVVMGKNYNSIESTHNTRVSAEDWAKVNFGDSWLRHSYILVSDHFTDYDKEEPCY